MMLLAVSCFSALGNRALLPSMNLSMALAMVAENRDVNTVLRELFAAEGSELYLRPANEYVSEGEKASFFDLMKRARQRHELIIGYRDAGLVRSQINPPNKEIRRYWKSGDMLVVLSLDDY